MYNLMYIKMVSTNEPKRTLNVIKLHEQPINDNNHIELQMKYWYLVQ